MNMEQLKGLVNFLPQGIRNNATKAITKALEMVDPTQIKTKEDALQVFQSLKSNGLPPDILNKVNSYLNNPLAGTIMGAMGLNKTEFKNGLQSLFQPDNSSALTKNTSSLLQGIDQL